MGKEDIYNKAQKIKNARVGASNYPTARPGSAKFSSSPSQTAFPALSIGDKSCFN